jgi:hypothetical protein
MGVFTAFFEAELRGQRRYFQGRELVGTASEFMLY